MNLLIYFICAAIVGIGVWFYRGSRGRQPFDKIPGPFWNRWSSFPLALAWIQGRKLHYVHGLHEIYGSCVRTGPNEIAISDPDEVRTIHKMGSGFLKGPWYERLKLQSTMLCIIPNKEHSERRKHFAKAFSAQNILQWSDIIEYKIRWMVKHIKMQAQRQEGADLLTWFQFMAVDLAGELCIGQSYKSENGHLTLYARNRQMAAILDGIREELAPSPRKHGRRNLLYFSPPVKSTMRTEGLPYQPLRWDMLSKDFSDQRLSFLSQALVENEDDRGLTKEEIMREAKAFIVAGSDTTAITSTYMIWALLKNPRVKTWLQQEIETLSEGYSISDVTKLKYLQMVISETLRLYGAVSGGLPRVVPKGGRELCQHFVPEGTLVTTQSYTLHRNPDIFPRPLEFDPDRWQEPTQEMKEAFMPFGIGGRVCIGMNLAQIELAFLACTFLREFPNAALHPSMTDADMEPVDLFVVTPKGDRCIVVVR